MATHHLEKAAWDTTELAESQYQEKEFMGRVLGCFMSTYDTLDCCQHCLL